MLKRRKIRTSMLKVAFPIFPVLVTFLLVGSTVCNAQESETCLNQFTGIGSISQEFFYTVAMRSNILGHFVMIPDAMSPQEGKYLVGETIAVQIDKSTLINGKPANSLCIDKLLGSGKRVLVKLKSAPELLTPSCSYTVDAKLTGTAASLTLID